MPRGPARQSKDHDHNRRPPSETKFSTTATIRDGQDDQTAGVECFTTGLPRRVTRAQALRNGDANVVDFHQAHDTLRKHYEELEHEHSILKAGKAETDSNMKKVLDENTVLRQSLQHCKDDLFRLQPLSQTSDAEISAHYGALLQQITSFVDGVFSHIDREAEQQKKAGKAPLPSLTMGDRDPEDFVPKFPSAAEYFLRREILRNLQIQLFDESVYLFGLGPAYTHMLQNVENGMSSLEPKRDTATVRNWRSETLAAITQLGTYASQRCIQGKEVAYDIFKVLCDSCPALGRQQNASERLYYQIVVPALELAVRLQLSPTRFYFHIRLARQPFGVRTRIFQPDLNTRNLVDVETRKTLTKTSLLTPDKDGAIGLHITTVEPTLLRHQEGKTSDVLVRKSTCVVQLYTPLGKRRRFSQSKEESIRQCLKLKHGTHQ